MADSWWGTHEVATDTMRQWIIGPLHLRMTHQAEEWCIGFRHEDDPTRNHFEVSSQPVVEPTDQAVTEPFQETLFGVSTTKTTVELKPALPDRFVVVRPESPLWVAPGESATLYTSIPLFVQIFWPNSELPLKEVTTYPLSDTWFGPDTMSGELCYALRIKGRLKDGTMPVSLHRAGCTVAMQNRSDEPLSVERIQLPVQALRLFKDSDGQLWTDRLTLVHHSDKETKVTVGPKTPDDAWVQIAPPRNPPNLFTRALGSLFGGRLA